MATTDPNESTVTDLSHLAAHSLTATAQEGGNMISSNAQAMTAPGSAPVTPVPKLESEQPNPNLDTADYDGRHIASGAVSRLGDGGRATWQAIRRPAE